MRLLHTADWHIGRTLHQVSLIEDQAWALERLIELARSEKPDAVLLAGDLYDRPMPPAEAVELVDHVFGALVLGLRIPVIAIAGHHDSPERLAFAHRLLREQGLHMIGPVHADPAPVVLGDRHGPVQIWPLPYAEPARVREVLEAPAVRTHDDAAAARFARVRSRRVAGQRAVVVAHTRVAGGRPCDSERPLAADGPGEVRPDHFNGFAYAALGHLHRPQSIAGATGPVCYSGALLKYSFSEAEDVKSVALVEIDGAGAATLGRIPLGARRDLRRVTGALSALLAAPVAAGREDYLEITLTDAGPVHDPLRRLRERFPNLLHVHTLGLTGGSGPGASGDPCRLTDAGLFGRFFEQATGTPLTPAEAAEIADVLATVRRKEDA